MKRRAPTSVRRLRRGVVRALVGCVGAMALALAAHALVTPFIGNTGAAGWVAGFIRATDAGLAHWNPKNADAHIAGGFTDWSPDLVYDGEPLPEDVVARYWCEYHFSRRTFWVFAPLFERATVDLRISDPNFAPAAPALVARYRPAAAGFVMAEIASARLEGAGRAPLWTRAFEVASLRARNGEFRRIYWRGAPMQMVAALLLGAGGGALLRAAWLLWRLRRAEAPADHPLCPRCLYDVSGQEVTACPECAQALAAGAG